MSEQDNINNLSEEERLILKHWKKIATVIKKDLAYIWIDEVKEEFEAIKGELEKIRYILTTLRDNYMPYGYPSVKKPSKKYINDIDNFILSITKLQASEKWIKSIYNQLREIMSDVEKIKIDRALEGIIFGWIICERADERNVVWSRLDKIFPWVKEERKLRIKLKKPNPQSARYLLASFLKNRLAAKDIIPPLKVYIQKQFKEPAENWISEEANVAYRTILKSTENQLTESLERIKPKISVLVK